MDGIKLHQISKSYQVEDYTLPVLRALTMDIPAGKITVLLGRSGCGKTTLLRIVGGLEKADSGQIVLPQEGKTAFVFQEPRLMPWLNTWDNVCFGLRKRQREPQFIARILEIVQLEHFARAYPRQLSGGMQQRVALARALAYRPSCILMDEPFAALDCFTRVQMQHELMRVWESEQISILFVTHSIEEALQLGHQLLILREGKIGARYQIDTPPHLRTLLSDEMITYKQEILSQIEQK